MMNITGKDGFMISTEKSKIDIEYVHRFLSRSYWSEGIPVQTVKKAVDGCLAFGVYYNEKQIGFARVITDGATFAYLADVFIDEDHSGKGLSKWLMEVIISHHDLQGLRRFMLATLNAHGLYEKFGFTPLNHAERWMQVHNPDVYKTK